MHEPRWHLITAEDIGATRRTEAEAAWSWQAVPSQAYFCTRHLMQHVLGKLMKAVAFSFAAASCGSNSP